MDGHFVPNLTIGPAVVKALRPHIGEAVRRPSDDLAGRPVPRCLRRGRRRHHHRPSRGRPAPPPHGPAREGLGKKAGVSLNPATPAKALDYVLEDIDLVLVMSVNPGFGGQKFITSQLKKIEAIANRIAKQELDVAARGRRRHRPRDRARRRSAPAPTCWSPAPRPSAAARANMPPTSRRSRRMNAPARRPNATLVRSSPAARCSPGSNARASR